MPSTVKDFLRSRWTFFLGLFAVLFYWFWVHTPGFGPTGYVEDFCIDSWRQVIAESIAKNGRPLFVTDSWMTPKGASVPFMSWSLERDWVGAYFWMWNRDFPFHWVYYGFSLVISYLGVGIILRKMKLSHCAAWGMATLAVLIHVPRHLKTYYHYEHLTEHWVYLAVFLDAWIWQRFYRERRWSWTLEIWRGFFMLGMLGTSGYFWGPMILEWSLIRLCLVTLALIRLKSGIKTEIDGRLKQIGIPVIAGLFLMFLDFRWFAPLFEEVKRFGPVFQPRDYYATFRQLFEPLWLKPLLPMITSRVNEPETVVTIGWLYWIPLLTSFWLLVRKKKWTATLPLSLFLFLILSYAIRTLPDFIRDSIQTFVPFMSFFRVASRMGLFLPATVGAVLVLAWPELSEWVNVRWKNGKMAGFRGILILFILLSGVEASWLAQPIKAMPPLDPTALHLLGEVKKLPGSAVLDLPFCVAGGNGICTAAQCPNYPLSTAGMCLRAWHGKKTYGLYQARMAPQHCDNYGTAPFTSWFKAWGERRCFEPQEWNEFCDYLDHQPELSAVLLYPEIWRGSGSRECLQQFDQHLGSPVNEAVFFLRADPGESGPVGKYPTRLLQFGAKCKR